MCRPRQDALLSTQLRCSWHLLLSQALCSKQTNMSRGQRQPPAHVTKQYQPLSTHHRQLFSIHQPVVCAIRLAAFCASHTNPKSSPIVPLAENQRVRLLCLTQKQAAPCATRCSPQKVQLQADAELCNLMSDSASKARAITPCHLRSLLSSVWCTRQQPHRAAACWAPPVGVGVQPGVRAGIDPALGVLQQLLVHHGGRVDGHAGLCRRGPALLLSRERGHLLTWRCASLMLPWGYTFALSGSWLARKVLG